MKQAGDEPGWLEASEGWATLNNTGRPVLHAYDEKEENSMSRVQAQRRAQGERPFLPQSKSHHLKQSLRFRFG